MEEPDDVLSSGEQARQTVYFVISLAIALTVIAATLVTDKGRPAPSQRPSGAVTLPTSRAPAPIAPTPKPSSDPSGQARSLAVRRDPPPPAAAADFAEAAPPPAPPFATGLRQPDADFRSKEVGRDSPIPRVSPAEGPAVAAHAAADSQATERLRAAASAKSAGGPLPTE
jgi:hypothetical protein